MLFYSQESSFHDNLRIPDECDNGPVCIFTRINIQQVYTPDRLNQSVICLITDISLPSLKFGTHSNILFPCSKTKNFYIIPKTKMPSLQNLLSFTLLFLWMQFSFNYSPPQDYCINQVASEGLRQKTIGRHLFCYKYIGNFTLAIEP